MRPTIATLGLCSLLMLTGCSDNWGFLRKAPDPALTNLGKSPTAEQLVTYLNQNSQRVRSMSCQDVDLECTQGFQSVAGLKGRMACEQPRDFRMTAMLMSHREFDLGSNDREFWFWIAKFNPPHQFYCSYEDLRTKNVSLPFPFQPEWVMEALGMANYPVNGRYQVQMKRDTIELIQDTTSLQGQPVRKVVVFNRNDAKNGGQIQAYILRDMKNNDICTAKIQDVQRVEGAVVPYKVLLTWPDQKIKLTMQLNKPTLNQVSPEMAHSLFQRSSLNGIQSYDLARQGRVVEDRNQVQQAGGYVR